jgi:AcrR family transcriptional regulator
MTSDSISTRERLLHALCAHVLDNGLATASLRPLARSAGTSDRMLIYHFGTKERLIEAVLAQLAADLERALTDDIPVERSRSLDACMAEIMALLRSDGLRRYMRVWLEVVVAAGLGHDDFRATGARILQRFLPWLEARLPEDVRDREATAAALLALVEGAIVMDAVGMGATADRAAQAMAGLIPKA